MLVKLVVERKSCFKMSAKLSYQNAPTPFKISYQNRPSLAPSLALWCANTLLVGKSDENGTSRRREECSRVYECRMF